MLGWIEAVEVGLPPLNILVVGAEPAAPNALGFAAPNSDVLDVDLAPNTPDPAPPSV